MAEHVEYREPAKWPTVVGVVSIVWGGLGLLCGVCGGVMMLMPSMMIGMVPEEQRAEVERQMAANAAWPIEYILLAFSVLLTVLLLVAGIMLVKRNPGARPMFLAYGAAGVLLSLCQVGVQYVKIPQAVKASVPAGATDEAIRQATFMGYAMAALMILLGMAWPAFCLIWFGLVKRDSRDLVPAESHEV